MKETTDFFRSEDTGAGTAYVVVEPSPVIAADLAEAIRAVKGDCDIQVFPKPEAAVVAVDVMPRVTAAFLSMRKEAIIASGLNTAVATRGGVIVVVSGSLASQEAADEGWLLLREPFTEDMLQSVLGRVISRG